MKATAPGSPVVIFAGGGSGGHLSPGLAIAERLQERSPEAHAVFLCSNREIDSMMLSEAGVEFVPLPASPPSIRPLQLMRFSFNFKRSKRIAARMMSERGATHVVTLGGFVAAPVVSAARARRVPITLVNLDAPPGKANLWMAKKASRIVTAIDLSWMEEYRGFASEVVGMPIRRRALAPTDAGTCRARLGLEPHVPTLLITGASQGATSINAFMVRLAETRPGFFTGWQVLHLTGHGAEDPVRRAYQAAGVRGRVEPFVSEIGLAWGCADLAISRAGASSVAEAASNAVPTLFLPYPYHADMHQKYNAQPLVDLPGGGGAALAIDLVDADKNVQTLGIMLRELMEDEGRRAAMRATLRTHPWPDGADAIARMLLAEG